MIYKQNDIVMFTSGAYSDYQVHGHYKVLREFDYDALLNKYKEENPTRKETFKVPEEWKRMKHWADKETFEKTINPTFSGLISHLESSLYIEPFTVLEEHHPDSWGDL